MAAARSLGVHVVEILHGYRYQPGAYDYETKCIEALPCELWALDDHSQKSFVSLQKRGVAVKRIKNPWHELVLLNDPQSDNPVKQYLNFLEAELLKFKGDRPMILLALTWGYEVGGPLEGIYSNGVFPEELGGVIKDHPDIYWIIRPHPVHLRDPKMIRSLNAISELVKSCEHGAPLDIAMGPLPSLLKFSDAFMTTSSSSAAEALEFRLPCFFFDSSRGSESFRAAFTAEIMADEVEVWKGSTEQIDAWVRDRTSNDATLSRHPLSAILHQDGGIPSAARLAIELL
jgi:hypothetical protein